MSISFKTVESIVQAGISSTGMVVRGGANFESPVQITTQFKASSVLLIGNVGPKMWSAFSEACSTSSFGDNPLDEWTKFVVSPIAVEVARQFSCYAIFPNDRPYWPFQKWAQMVEPVAQSPLGLFIHPKFGLWHAYRAALLFEDILDVAEMRDVVSPCSECRSKPCLTTCPVSAFRLSGFQPDKCGSFLETVHGTACSTTGCAARNACPVGSDYKYSQEQLQFHMASFKRSRSIATLKVS